MKNTNYILIVSFLCSSLVAMEKPDELQVLLKTVSSEYKNPIVVKLMNVVFSKGEFKSDSFGELKTVVRVTKGQPLFYNQPISMLEVDNESRACLLIEDCKEPSNFTTVWLRHEYVEEGTGIFEAPDVDESREEFTFERGKPMQTAVTLRLLNKEALGMPEKGVKNPYISINSKTSAIDKK